MAHELEARLWWAAPKPLGVRLAELAQALQTVVPEVRWLETVVETRFPREKVSVEPGAPDADQVTAALETSQAVKVVRATFSLPCWRFQGHQAEWAGVVGGIEVWDTAAYTKLGQVRETEGDGKFYLSNSGPFTGLVATEESPSAQAAETNVKVEENVQSLLEVVVGLFTGTGAVKAALYDDGGWVMPLNAHAVFYSDVQRVLQDLELLATLWTSGLGLYPAVQHLGNDLDEALHPWRSEVQRKQLFEAWQHTGGERFKGKIGEADVRQVLASGHHDVLETEGGFGVLDFPLLMNGFVAPFFLELLDRQKGSAPVTPTATSTGSPTRVGVSHLSATPDVKR